MMGEWHNNKNHGGNASEREAGENLGEEAPSRWDRVAVRSLTGGLAEARGPPGSDGGEESGCELASWWTGLDDAVALGRRRGKLLYSMTSEKINWNKYIETSEKYETLHGDRFEYLP
jgi:hypothetical protein